VICAHGEIVATPSRVCEIDLACLTTSARDFSERAFRASLQQVDVITLHVTEVEDV